MPAPHRHGLAGDLQRLLHTLNSPSPISKAPANPTLTRRQTLRWLSAGAVSLSPLGLMGCGSGGASSDSSTASSSSTTTTTTDSTASSSGASSTSSTSSSTASASTTSSCSEIPTETAGPYPADGSLASSQRLNALALSGIVRSDIRTSVGAASGTAAGVLLTVKLKIVSTNANCANLAGRAVYLWHCTQDGGYSLYSSGITGENYLRGVQVTDSNGEVTFVTVFPGCYSGRWPHIHFEVYPSLAAATDATAVSDYTKVSQLALPATTCTEVYTNVSGYSSSLRNLASISLATDNIFSNDNAALQMATVTGNASTGYTASLTVGVTS